MYNIDEIKNKIICGDCLEELPKIPDNSIDAVVTSPPYNKNYYNKHRGRSEIWMREIEYNNFSDDLEPEVYAQQQIKILTELIRIIKPTGSIFYNHKSIIYQHRIIFPQYIFNFNIRQIIIWDRGSSPIIDSIRFFPTTEYIFWITKINKTPKFYKDKAIFDKEIWRIPPSNTPEHPACFPEQLPTNCILATTDEGDIVLDPYIGIGTTAIASKKLNRNYIGIEINSKYVEIAEEKLKKVEENLFTKEMK